MLRLGSHFVLYSIYLKRNMYTKCVFFFSHVYDGVGELVSLELALPLH